MKNTVWPLVHAERRALIGFLETLDDADWDEPSWCVDWTVHDVLAHLVDTAKINRRRFAARMVRARFDFDRANAFGVEHERRVTGRQTLQAFRAVVDRTSTAPAPLDTRLVEAIVHGEDIRRPLGAIGSYPVAAIERALRLQARTSTSFGGGKQLVAGLQLAPSDAEFSIGDGPPVTGPALALLLVASGRNRALTDLAGPGLPTLTDRMNPG